MYDKRLRVLVVDDHPLFLESIKYLLKNEFQMDVVDTAINGSEAIEKARSGNIDLIFMDIHMPVVNGIQATASIKNLYPSIKIIILISISDIPSLYEALDAGADGVIFKDSNYHELTNALKSIQKNNIYIDSSIVHHLPMNKKEVKSGGVVQWSENLITAREQSVLQHIKEGYTDSQIADKLFLSKRTVEMHRKNIMAKLNLKNNDALIKFAMENKIEQVPEINKASWDLFPGLEAKTDSKGFKKALTTVLRKLGI